MDIANATRGALPVVGAVAATALVGAGLAYGAVSVAGESDGGTPAELLGQLGGMALVTGGVVGLASGGIVGRLHATSALGGARGLAMLPVAIAGAALGGRLARAGLGSRHQGEYDRADASIADTITRTQSMFRTAGADEDVLAAVPTRYDRSFFNAAYAPPLGPFFHDITVGRSSETGETYAVRDVVAHEFAHRVAHAYAPLLGRSIGGDGHAIHESLADTFAMAVDTDDWLMGEDALDGGMRSFSHPEERGAVEHGKVVPAPITREQLAHEHEEHLGAGVGNKVAWRIGSELGRPELAHLYVAALERRELGFNSGYDDLANAVRGAAIDLYGAGSANARLVDDAWRQAGY